MNLKIIDIMFNFKSNPNNLRTNCSYCGGTGKPISKDSGCTVVVCQCNAAWEGNSLIREQEIYNAKKSF